MCVPLFFTGLNSHYLCFSRLQQSDHVSTCVSKRPCHQTTWLSVAIRRFTSAQSWNPVTSLVALSPVCAPCGDLLIVPPALRSTTLCNKTVRYALCMLHRPPCHWMVKDAFHSQLCHSFNGDVRLFAICTYSLLRGTVCLVFEARSNNVHTFPLRGPCTCLSTRSNTHSVFLTLESCWLFWAGPQSK